MFVLSANSASTPLEPSSAKRCTSKCSPSIGVWSILKSPVWTIDADRRVNRQRDAVGHAVRDADELDLERADRHALARPHRDEAVRAVEAVLAQLRLDERQRQRRAVDRAVDVRQHVRHGADVILVAVRQHQGRDRALSAAGT